MTPIPIADPPRSSGPRPDAEAKTADDRPDPEEGVPEAFLVAMGLVPGATAPQPTSPDTSGDGTPLPRTETAAPAPAAPPLAARPPTVQAAGACGDLAEADAAPGSSAADVPVSASPTAVSVGEMAFRASNLAAEPSTGSGGDAGSDGRPAEAIAGASDPAMSGDGGGATGSDGQTADPAEQASRPRARAAGAEPAPVTAHPAGEDTAAQPPKGAAASASGAETAPASAAAAGAKPAFRATADSSGAADALSATSGAIADPGIGVDPAASARTAERPHHATQAAATLPPGFGHRLAEAVAHFPDRGVELTLSPEELGRVRMMLSTHDGALTLSIQADRPETIDLMRRHIDQLAQDFRDLGFADVSFSFSRDDTAPGGQGAERETGDPAVTAAEDSPLRNAAAPAGARRGGLDLRL